MGGDDRIKTKPAPDCFYTSTDRTVVEVPQLLLAPPDWDAVQGGTAEQEWLADRQRKFAAANLWADQLIELQGQLRALGAEFSPTPEILKAHPLSAVWYISLLGYSDKTLKNVSGAPRSFGLTQQPASLVKSLREGRRVNEEQVDALSRWLSATLDQEWPTSRRIGAVSLAIASMLIGGRIIGQGQNEGGEIAATLLKSLLVCGLTARGCKFECEIDGAWQAMNSNEELVNCQRIRFNERLICEFVPGGDRPDIKVVFDEVVIAVGEIKGRKDLSNAWESWMPQVVDHMTTWHTEFPAAARLFMGTLITRGMIEGVSSKGTRRVGLRDIHDDGRLDTVFNLSKAAQNDPGAKAAIEDFMDQLSALIRPNA